MPKFFFSMSALKGEKSIGSVSGGSAGGGLAVAGTDFTVKNRRKLQVPCHLKSVTGSILEPLGGTLLI